jgi:hypothetical protein
MMNRAIATAIGMKMITGIRNGFCLKSSIGFGRAIVLKYAKEG